MLMSVIVGTPCHHVDHVHVSLAVRQHDFSPLFSASRIPVVRFYNVIRDGAGIAPQKLFSMWAGIW